MANVLAMSKSLSIQSLRAQGWSRHRISRELGIDRKTVRRYLASISDPSPGSPPTPLGMEPLGGGGFSNVAQAPLGVLRPDSADFTHAGLPKPLGELSLEREEPSTSLMMSQPAGSGTSNSKSPTQAPPGSRSECEPFRQIILDKLKQALHSRRIYQDLVSEYGFSGKYWSVRRFVRRLEGQAPLPFRRMECDPGMEAQMDFGQGARVNQPDVRPRRPHVLRVVLSHSRKAYSEAVWRQTTDEVIRVLENAFYHFGGVPRTLVPDNLKAVVNQADWYDPEINPKFRSFCEHYGIAVLPTKPYMPRHKGKVENGIQYVQDNGLKGREFKSLEEQNHHLLQWESHVADQRLHGTTRQQVGRIFKEVEKPALLPLPADRFPCFQEARRSVHRDAHVEVAKAYYSVPPEYLGHQVWARWDGRMVRLFNLQMKEIAVHVQKQPGRFSTLQEHLAREKISHVEKGAGWMLAKARLIGPESHAWAAAMLQQRGIEGLRVLMGLLSLGKRYPLTRLEEAARVAHSHQAYALRTVRQLCEREDGREQERFEFAKEHEIIRPLSDYGRFAAW